MAATRTPRLSSKEYTILELLVARGELYGLQIVRESEGRVGQGTLYVTLNRMAEKGYVESRQQEQQPGAFGPPRRMYKATGYGARVMRAEDEMAARFCDAATVRLA